MKKHHEFTLNLKHEVIKAVEKEPRIGICKLANMFSCGRTQISMPLKNKDRIVEFYEANASDEMCQMCKRICGSTFSEVNEALYD